MSTVLNSSTEKSGYFIADGGCDTTVCAKGFTTISTTNRKTNLVGFKSNKVEYDIPIGTACTAVDLEDSTIIIKVNEALLLKDNSNSLLSSTQATEHRIMVDDVATRYGG